MGAKNRQKIGEKFGGYLKNPYLCNGFRDETYFHNIFNNSKVFTMSKKEFLEARNAEKAAKKVAIAQTGINENYDAQSAEYKAFRCKVNKWQKECRDYYNAEYNLQFKGCFRFEVLSGTFKVTPTSLKNPTPKKGVGCFTWNICVPISCTHLSKIPLLTLSFPH